MQAFEIHVGEEYGYRDTPKRADPLQRVRVLDHVRSKWKVEWIDPNPGLQEYVKSVQLIVPWSEHRDFLREEAGWTRLGDVCDRTWPGHDHPVTEAVQLVLDSTGEQAWVENMGAFSATPDGADRIATRARI